MTRWNVTHNSWEESTIYRDGEPYATVYIDPDVDEDSQARLEAQKEARAERIFCLLLNDKDAPE